MVFGIEDVLLRILAITNHLYKKIIIYKNYLKKVKNSVNMKNIKTSNKKNKKK